MTLEVTCPRCNFSKKVPKEKIPFGVRWANCPRCKEIFEFAPSNLDFPFLDKQVKTDADNQKENRLSPWEERSDLGFWQGIYQTFKKVLFSPKDFFTGMTHTGGIKEPMAFGLLLGSMGTMFGLFWQFIIIYGIIYGHIRSFNMVLPDQYALNLIFLGIMIISPLFVLLNMFVTGLIIHGCLHVINRKRSSFEGTFRVVTFSQSSLIIGFIPIIGGGIGWIWQIILLIIGLKSIHGTSYIKVIISVLVTLLIKGFILLPAFLIKSIVSGSMTFIG